MLLCSLVIAMNLKPCDALNSLDSVNTVLTLNCPSIKIFNEFSSEAGNILSSCETRLLNAFVLQYSITHPTVCSFVRSVPFAVCNYVIPNDLWFVRHQSLRLSWPRFAGMVDLFTPNLVNSIAKKFNFLSRSALWVQELQFLSSQLMRPRVDYQTETIRWIIQQKSNKAQMLWDGGFHFESLVIRWWNYWYGILFADLLRAHSSSPPFLLLWYCTNSEQFRRIGQLENRKTSQNVTMMSFKSHAGYIVEIIATFRSH